MQTKPVYRVYCDGRELGLDYTKARAIEVAKEFRTLWPQHRYYARRFR